MPDFSVSERESVNLNSSGSLLYQKPPTPTSSPPPTRRRTTSNSSTELVRQSHDFTDIMALEEDFSNAIKAEELHPTDDSNSAETVPGFRDAVPNAPVVCDSRVDSRTRCATVTRTHSLKEPLIRKFGTDYSSRFQVGDKTSKHSRLLSNQAQMPRADSGRSNMQRIASQLKSQSPGRDTAKSLASDLISQSSLKNHNSPKRISSFIPQEDSGENALTPPSPDTPTPQSCNTSSIPLTSYLPTKFPHPAQPNSEESKLSHQAKSSKEIRTRSSSVNRSGVVVPDSTFGHGIFKIQKSPSTVELPISNSVVDSSLAQKNSSATVPDFNSKNQSSPNSTLNKQSESNHSSPTPAAQKLTRGTFVRHRAGSTRASNVVVLPDRMLKDKANSSECLSVVGVSDYNYNSGKKWPFSKNGSQESLTGEPSTTNVLSFTPRPPTSKRPGTDSDDFSEPDAKLVPSNSVLPSRRSPIKTGCTIGDQKVNIINTKQIIKPASVKGKDTGGMEDSDVDSNIEDDNPSDVDAVPNTLLGDIESNANMPSMTAPKIRQPSAHKITRHSPPSSSPMQSCSSMALVSSSPPKSVTFNLNAEQDASELRSRHRHRKHHRNGSNEGVHSDRPESSDHGHRSSRVPKQAFVNQVIPNNDERIFTFEHETKPDYITNAAVTLHENFITNVTENLKDQMNAMQNFKNGVTSLESYKESISMHLNIHEQAVKTMIKYWKKE